MKIHEQHRKKPFLVVTSITIIIALFSTMTVMVPLSKIVYATTNVIEEFGNANATSSPNTSAPIGSASQGVEDTESSSAQQGINTTSQDSGASGIAQPQSTGSIPPTGIDRDAPVAEDPGLPPIAQAADVYNAKVTLNSITINNDHEGRFSGDGEFDMAAYIQGKLIHLTKVKPDLWDADQGSTYTFPATATVSAVITGNQPLVIQVMGQEVDWCKAKEWPNVETQFNALMLEGTQTNQSKESDFWDKVVEYVGDLVVGKVGCWLNGNEELGNIEKQYTPPTFEAGPHEVASSSNDYILRYTIEASKQ